MQGPVSFFSKFFFLAALTTPPVTLLGLVFLSIVYSSLTLPFFFRLPFPPRGPIFLTARIGFAWRSQRTICRGLTKVQQGTTLALSLERESRSLAAVEPKTSKRARKKNRQQRRPLAYKRVPLPPSIPTFGASRPGIAMPLEADPPVLWDAEEAEVKSMGDVVEEVERVTAAAAASFTSDSSLDEEREAGDDENEDSESTESKKSSSPPRSPSACASSRKEESDGDPSAEPASPPPPRCSEPAGAADTFTRQTLTWDRDTVERGVELTCQGKERKNERWLSLESASREAEKQRGEEKQRVEEREREKTQPSLSKKHQNSEREKKK